MAAKTLDTDVLIIQRRKTVNPRAAYAISAALFAGCASVPDRVNLPAQTQLSKVQIDFRDGRPMPQIAGSRFESGTSISVVFADDQFSTSHVRLLRTRLEAALGEQIGKRTVVLRRFEVSAMHGYSLPGNPSGTYVPRPAGVSGGDMFAGGLLAGLLIHGIESAKADRTLRSFIRLEIDGVELDGGAWKSAGGSDSESALAALVVSSIEDLLTKVREHLAKEPSPK